MNKHKRSIKLKPCRELVELPADICTRVNEITNKKIRQHVSHSTWHRMQPYLPKGERIEKAKKKLQTA